jgi:hypothetical protein
VGAVGSFIIDYQCRLIQLDLESYSIGLNLFIVVTIIVFDLSESLNEFQQTFADY